jgi:hypothetical protein
MDMPVPAPTPYPEVNAILHELLGRVRAILGPRFLGMYLYGSLTLGDFSPLTSDVDFVVVTDAGLPPDLVAALHAMHADLAATWVPWGAELEGSYIPLPSLGRHDPTQAPYPRIERGEELRVHKYDSGNIIQRYLLREHGIPLAGPPIQAWIDPVHPDDLRRDVAAIAREWLVPMRDDPLPLRHRGYQAYIVLTICRMLYTLQFGTIVSKPTAARWAREALGPRWAPLIDRALADDTNETRDLIRYALDHIPATPPGKE